MTVKMELAFNVQKIPIFMLMIIVSLLPGVSGLIIDNTTATSCDGSRANITFAIDLQTGTIPTGSEAWFHESTIIATKTGGVFSPQGNYTSRLHSYSTYGIALDSVTEFDAGRYFLVFSYYSPAPQGLKTATATLTVKVTPSENCMPSYRQFGNLAICELDQAANCGLPRLEPMWMHTSGNNFTVVNPGTYRCCANGSILMDCYRGHSSLCKTFYVSAATTTTVKETSGTSASASIPSIINTSTANTDENDSHQRVIIISVSVGVLVIVTVIIIIICFHHRRKTRKGSSDETKITHDL